MILRCVAGCLLLLSRYAVAADTGRFTTICDCDYTNAPCRGEFRWAVKTEAFQPRDLLFWSFTLTPSEMSRWEDLSSNDITKTYKSDEPRFKEECFCWQLTGRVALVRAEPDGDLHVQLRDATGTNEVNVGVEIPAGEPWCAAREAIFGLVKEQPPFNAPKLLTVTNNAVVTVTGRAFYDGAHAGGQHAPNRRNYDANVTIWEIHPVMTLDRK